MSHHEHKELSPKSVSCAVLTISDSRTEETDESGHLLKQRLADHGHALLFYALLKNDSAAIRETLEDLVGRPDIQVIITTGGTGVSRRDVTVETVSPMLEKRFDGFGELFRYLTYQDIGTTSVMSRAMAGVIKSKVVISLPGSLGAVTLGVDRIILPEIGHMVREATR
jgi:molybdenum cofactor biosynthesis protein B